MFASFSPLGIATGIALIALGTFIAPALTHGTEM
jgi:hypothetical protein